MQNRREFYRIRYPIHERPRLVHGTSISEVVECSERGVRVLPAGEVPTLGTRVEGRLALCHGAQVPVSGTVIWRDERSVAIHLDSEPVPFLAVLREQLHLRRLARRPAPGR